ncbi:MAG: hypothetical protein PHG25_00675 [Candidatus Pacebacteria bacterium]|nr:hypothetical protein [Candidatus Paceibacterota bacterium]
MKKKPKIDVVAQLTKEAIRAEIEPVLQTMGIPYKTWGRKGATRHFKDFVSAMSENELRWEYESQSRILEMDVAVITVRIEIDGQLYELRETHRKFKNGFVEKRDKFDGSLAETVKDNETAYAAAIRGLAEELGQTKKLFETPSTYHLVLDSYETLEPQDFPSYPPFQIIYHRRKFISTIDKRLYAKRYKCVEKNKTTYFGWVKI